MNELELIRPSAADAENISVYRAEFPADRMRVTYVPNRIPGMDHLEEYGDVSDWLHYVETMAGKITWYMSVRKSDGKTVGFLCLRHKLEYDDDDIEFASNIGYSVRPSERGKGYGKEQLCLALKKAKALGLHQVRIVCRDTNTASRNIILANGGIYADTIHGAESGLNVCRYDIFLE